jgi:hypothetical protein
VLGWGIGLASPSPGKVITAMQWIIRSQQAAMTNSIFMVGFYFANVHRQHYLAFFCKKDTAVSVSGTPTAAGDPAPYINTNTGENIVAYRGSDGHIHTLYWSTGDVGHDNLSGFARSPQAAGDPVAYYTSHNDEHQVTYRGTDRHIYELRWRGVEPVRHWDVTAHAGAPPADSDPAVYYSAGTNTKHYIYRSADNHLHEIRVIPGGLPTHVDITLEARAPLATDKSAAFIVAGPDTHHAVYRGTDGQIHEIRWTSHAPTSTYAGQLLSYGDAGTPGNVSNPVVVGFGGWLERGERKFWTHDRDAQSAQPASPLSGKSTSFSTPTSAASSSRCAILILWRNSQVATAVCASPQRKRSCSALASLGYPAATGPLNRLM